MAIYKVVDKNGKKLTTDVLLHPGEVLADELIAREIRQKEFDLELDIDKPYTSFQERIQKLKIELHDLLVKLLHVCASNNSHPDGFIHFIDATQGIGSFVARFIPFIFHCVNLLK